MEFTGSCPMTTLNDDCFFNIFEYLQLNTLCQIGQTCKRLKELVEMFFGQRFQDKILSEVRIQVTFDDQFVLLPGEKYVTFFLKYMRNVALCEGFEIRPLDMVEFMRSNCSDNFCKIAFEQIKFHELHSELLIDWLTTVEELEFIGCQNLNQILRYCGNLKSLKVDQYSKDQSNEWMDQRYPTLERLQYDIVLPQHKLITFLTNNPNVKSVCLKLDRTEQSIVKIQYFQLIRQLDDVKLEELLINLDNFHYLIRFNFGLQEICNASQFRRLELCFNRSKELITQFTGLKYLNHLHGLHILRCDTIFPSGVVLEHLKVLQLSDVSSGLSTVDLSQSLPNLEELYLMTLEENFQFLVTPFARYSANLKKIVARDFKIPNRMYMTNFRLAQLFNDDRKQLANACKLTIYIGKDEFDESLDRRSPKFPLLQIRRVELQLKKVCYARPFVSNFEF